MPTWDAVAYFALGTMFGCLLSAMAINNFALRMMRRSTAQLRAARMAYHRAVKSAGADLQEPSS